MRDTLNHLFKIRLEATNCKFISSQVKDDAMKRMFGEMAEELRGFAELIDQGLLKRAPFGKG